MWLARRIQTWCSGMESGLRGKDRRRHGHWHQTPSISPPLPCPDEPLNPKPFNLDFSCTLSSQLVIRKNECGGRNNGRENERERKILIRKGFFSRYMNVLYTRTLCHIVILIFSFHCIFMFFSSLLRFVYQHSLCFSALKSPLSTQQIPTQHNSDDSFLSLKKTIFYDSFLWQFFILFRLIWLQIMSKWIIQNWKDLNSEGVKTIGRKRKRESMIERKRQAKVSC